MNTENKLTPPTAATPTKEKPPLPITNGYAGELHRYGVACRAAATPSAGDAERQIGVVRITEDEIAVDLTDESGLRDGQPVFTRPQGAATLAVDAGPLVSCEHEALNWLTRWAIACDDPEAGERVEILCTAVRRLGGLT